MGKLWEIMGKLRVHYGWFRLRVNNLGFYKKLIMGDYGRLWVIMGNTSKKHMFFFLKRYVFFRQYHVITGHYGWLRVTGELWVKNVQILYNCVFSDNKVVNVDMDCGVEPQGRTATCLRHHPAQAFSKLGRKQLPETWRDFQVDPWTEVVA